MRLFVAVDLPADLRARLGAIQEALRPAPLHVRWARAGGIHLTLKFLGEVAAERLETVEAALREAGRGIRPFRLEAAGVGTFPEGGLPRVIWVGVCGDLEALTRLHEEIDRALEGIGFPAEERDYHPHLTLGRVKGPGRGDWRSHIARSAHAPAGAFSVEEYVLFESRLGPQGPAYNALAGFPLVAGGSS